MQQTFQCYKCGAQNYFGQQCCWSCQSYFQYDCPKCNHDIQCGQQQCPSCGQFITWQPYEVAPFKQAVAQSNTQTIDMRRAECPYCRAQLKKIPGAKTKCPQCGNYMRVKTRPSDGARVVVTEEEAQRIDEEWTMVNGTHDLFILEKNKIEEARRSLREEFGQEPSERDVKWAVLNRKLIEHARNGDWGLYRNIRFDMAEVLRKENRLPQALQTYLEICYIDLNGPNNTAGARGVLLREFPPFDPKHLGLIAPGVTGFINQTIRYLQLDEARVKSIFFEHNSRIQQTLRLPLSPDRCWQLLREHILIT